jgi:integrase
MEGRKARADAANSLKAVAEEHLQREAKRLRSIRERRRIFERYIYPDLGGRQIDSIKRSEIVRLLDRIEDRNGPSMADHVLSVLRRLMSWHATRSDDFRSPITRGMARTRPAERARERVLSDEELRLLWSATEGWASPYAYLVRFLLLTATRLREAAEMRRHELTGNEWVIPARRHKSKRDFLIPLSQAAVALLAGLPSIGSKDWVFTTAGDAPISGFSKFKRQLDTRIAREMESRFPKTGKVPRWTNHDLRRTARSLMSRAGVDPDHAERALGHVIGGVRGTYDRHAFDREKARAFQALAEQVGRILDDNPNVVLLRSKHA